MKTITIDDELYAHIAAQTKYIGEGASDILRRLLLPDSSSAKVTPEVVVVPEPSSDSVSTVEETPPVTQPDQTVSPETLALDATAILACSTVVERFLLVLSAIHKANPAAFNKVLNIRGKGRDYFANSKQHLLATGSSTNPKAIPDSDYWVVTNNNTSKKASILRLVSEAIGYDEKVQQDIVQSLTLKN